MTADETLRLQIFHLDCRDGLSECPMRPFRLHPYVSCQAAKNTDRPIFFFFFLAEAMLRKSIWVFEQGNICFFPINCIILLKCYFFFQSRPVYT